MPQIILASASKARKKLMKELSIAFHCHASDYEEDMTIYKTPHVLAKFLALQKARTIAKKYPDSIIIGADTFGSMDDEILGKPNSITAAKEMIRKFSNNNIHIHTGLAVIQTDKSAKITKEITLHTVTNLTFTKISEKEINEIVKKDDVLRVAGALTIEGESGKFVKTIDGDYHNVMGLPIFQLKKMLITFGIKL